MNPETCIGLLRGINVGGRNRVPMADLRELCASLGWQDVRTYIQSGNIVFTAEDEPAPLETALEGGIAARFGLEISVIVRSARDWKQYIAANPFPDASESDPKFVHLMLSKEQPALDAVSRLADRGRGGERVALAGGAIWIDYASGVGRSKLTPALIDRLVGSPVTGRNWRTVLKLAEMSGDRQP